MKVPQHLIDEATRRGIVPGAEVSCYIAPSDTGIVQPFEKWEHGCGGWHFIDPSNNAIYVVAEDNSRFATVITTAPSQGLEEGMATECSPAMRAAIIERAKELGVGVSCLAQNSGLPHLVCHDNSIASISKSGPEAKNWIQNHEFLARLEATAKKPKPIRVNDYDVQFLDGKIKIGCTTVDNETVRAIAAKLQD